MLQIEPSNQASGGNAHGESEVSASNDLPHNEPIVDDHNNVSFILEIGGR